ncbi:MAG: hypothetical protein ACRCWU_00760 [Metamycoplasmataceae bacterium]
MTKDKIEDYLHNKFNLVLSNENSEKILEKNMNTLGIYKGSPEHETFVKISTFIAQNEEKKNLFFIYYDGKYGIRFKSNNKNLVFFDENNADKVSKFSFLSFIKDKLPKTNNYVVFYTLGKVDFEEKHGLKSHILVVNKDNMTECLSPFFDIKIK